MASSATYPVDERTKGGRLAQRTTYDAQLIQEIVNETSILHVSFNAPLKEPPQFPTVLPMLGAFGTYGDDEEPSIYLHGSSVARLFKLTAGAEVPLCICATLFDGWVLALAPFHNSCNYRCAVVYGYGSVITDPDEILYGLKLITNNGIPQRWESSRPTNKAELTATAVLKVRIETASVKTRAGGPSDDKADLQNPEVVDKTWIGVVPVYQTLASPIAGEHNKVKQLPEYLDDWVADANSMAEQRAVDAVDGEGDYGLPNRREQRS